MTPSLPAAPSLEQLRRQAKELQRAHAAGDPAAHERAAAHRADPDKPLKLAGAQHVLAREYGFASWPRMRAYVERLTTYGDALEHAFHEDLDYYEGRADGLLASAQDGTPAALAALRADRDPADPGGRARAGGASPRVRDVGGAAPPRRPLCARTASRSRGPTAPSRAAPTARCASSWTASRSSCAPAGPTATTC